MRNKLLLYGMFSLAVMLFVAKPFMGFAALADNTGHITVNNILVKCFAQRKPEDLRDNEVKQALHVLLNNPPLNPLVSITLLLAILFPFLSRNKYQFTRSYLNSIRYSLIPAKHPYLLTGKLSI